MNKYVVDIKVNGTVSIVVDSDSMISAKEKASEILRNKIDNDEFIVSISAFAHEDVRRVAAEWKS
jgi:predicted dinucleotide-utilizing enzyme